jgi:3-isopropylmalate/(R)-2-methylmalate dehydratase small subunit
VLNREPFKRAQVLIAGANFGCGSTREGAVYALADFGIRCVIAPSFGDIFYATCLQNGLLPLVLPEEAVARLAAYVERHPGAEIAVDLEAQSVTGPERDRHRFDIEPSRKHRMLKGLDDIGVTLEFSKQIDDFESNYRAKLPWLVP